MLKVWFYSIFSVVIVSLISFLGIFTLSIKEKKLRKSLIYLVSFSTGALLGDAFIHLLPSAVKEYGFGLSISLSVISGIAFSFVVEKFIHWRHCHNVGNGKHIHPFAIVNLYGDSIHNFIDGVIIGAGYLIGIDVGIATTIAVILHEIPQEIGDFAILLHGGFTKGKALFYNFLTALTAIAGLAVSLISGIYINNIIAFLVPFSAGSLIYIAGSDLIPEMHKEVAVKKSTIQFVLFLLGIFVMFFLLYLE